LSKVPVCQCSFTNMRKNRAYMQKWILYKDVITWSLLVAKFIDPFYNLFYHLAVGTNQGSDK